MKIIFAGTPQFAEIALDVLIHSEHDIVAVFTQPDRRAGRGLKVLPSAVKKLALHYQLPIYQVTSLKGEYEQTILKELKADIMVVAAYGMLLPQAVLTIPRLGCINIHPSLLPRWRGAAPIPRAIYAGDPVTGVTIMQMDMGLDTGPILLQREINIHQEETAATLHDRLAQLGAQMLLETLGLLEKDQVTIKPQDSAHATYAHKMSKEEALIDWTRPAFIIEREIRAFNPWPIAHTSWQGDNLRVWFAKALESTTQKEPRTIIDASSQGIEIATGDGVLRLLKVQLPGAKPLSIADFFHAQQTKLIIGDKFL